VPRPQKRLEFFVLNVGDVRATHGEGRDTLQIGIETRDGEAGSRECGRQREADVALADDCNAR